MTPACSADRGPRDFKGERSAGGGDPQLPSAIVRAAPLALPLWIALWIGLAGIVGLVA